MDLSNVSITTSRLIITPVSNRFAKYIFDETTPEVTKYLTFDNSGKIEDTFNFILLSQNNIKLGNEMPVVIVEKRTYEFIGCAGIHNIKSEKPELGIWIKKSAQRKGYGKETISALIHWTKNNLHCREICYPVAKKNVASRRLIESLGGVISEERIFTSPSGKILDEVVYLIRLNVY